MTDKKRWEEEHMCQSTVAQDSFRRVLLEAEKHFPGTIGAFSSAIDRYDCHLHYTLPENIGDLLPSV